MNPSPNRAREIFVAALKLAPEQWQAYLGEACGDDKELRSRVQNLLDAHREAGSFLAPATGLVATRTEVAERPDSVIGPYKLLQQIGEGGMGTVYMAEQEQPVRRRVALKIIKPGMDSAAVTRRFEAERQALALMDHPNIAKVFDGGTTDSGRLYFVMELVKGVPITKYCDERHLTPRQRLELFAPVCQAVQHAHQKGIIHRDLKPSNVLVAEYDDKPVVKVIDFGVAKAIGPKLTERTLFTEFGQVVGTLEYMSPEQAKLNALDIDTRSDIYALGVLLYELLTGTTPFQRKRLEQAAFDDILRIIREEEPPKPSTRLSTTEELPSIAANRGMEPKKLSGLVRGELDWIVMKCLEKDRGRRYETANGLAMDVQRYLADEAVQACPPSAPYRLRKFARKYRKALVMVSVLGAMLVTATAVSSWLALRAIRAEKQAGQEAQNARTEAAISKAINEFLQKDILEQANPYAQPDRELRLRTVLDRAAQRIEGRFAEQPLIEAAIRRTIGEAYLGLGEFQKGRPHLERALELFRQRLGEEHLDTLSAMEGLGWLHSGAGQHELAESLLSRVVAIRRRVQGEEHPNTLESMSRLGSEYFEQKKLDKTEALYAQVLDARRRVLGEQHRDTLAAMSDLGQIVNYQAQRSRFYQAQRSRSTEQFDRAEALLKQALDLSERTLGAEDPVTLQALDSLGMVYYHRQKYDKAEPLFVRSSEGMRRVFGLEHRDTFTCMHNLGMVYMSQGKFDKAEKLTREALEARSRILGPEHYQTMESMMILSNVYMGQRKFADAEPLVAKLLEIYRSRGAESPAVMSHMSRLGEVHWNMKRLDRSIPIFEQLLTLQRRKLDDSHPDTVHTLGNLAVNYRDANRPAEATQYAIEFLARYAKLPVSQRGRFYGLVAQAAGILEAAGQPEKAEAIYRQEVEDNRKQFGPDHIRTAGALFSLGTHVMQYKRWTEAETALRACLAIRAKQQPDSWMMFNTQSMLGGALLGQQKYADAEPLLIEGYEGMKQREAKIAANAKPRLKEALERLVELYDAWGKKDEAAKWRKELAKVKASGPTQESKQK